MFDWLLHGEKKIELGDGFLLYQHGTCVPQNTVLRFIAFWIFDARGLYSGLESRRIFTCFDSMGNLVRVCGFRKTVTWLLFDLLFLNLKIRLSKIQML